MKITSNIPKINEQPKVTGKNVESRVKIDGGFNEVLAGKLNENAKAAEQKPVDKNIKFVGGEAQANASKQAAHMKEMVNTIKNVPDIRQDKVEEIKAKIANGTYNVSSEDLADKLMSSGLIDGLLKTI